MRPEGLLLLMYLYPLCIPRKCPYSLIAQLWLLFCRAAVLDGLNVLQNLFQFISGQVIGGGLDFFK